MGKAGNGMFSTRVFRQPMIGKPGRNEKKWADSLWIIGIIVASQLKWDILFLMDET
jgi:hypothetical protein